MLGRSRGSRANELAGPRFGGTTSILMLQPTALIRAEDTGPSQKPIPPAHTASLARDRLPQATDRRR
jgi:hypothetical protein